MTEEKNLTVPSDVAGALAAFGGVETLLNQVEASDAEVQQELKGEQVGGVDFMNFTPHAEYNKAERLSPWNYGQDDGIDVHPDSEWVVDVTTFEHGWFGFEKKNGKVVKGRQPDSVFTAWNTKFPPKPEDKDWCDMRTWKFRAICRSSPLEDQIGAYVEVTEYRKMKKGFAELEQALRERTKQIKAALQVGNRAQAAELARDYYPVIKFKFNLGVETGSYGRHNQGIVELVGWSSPVIDTETPAPAKDEGDLESELAAETPPAATTTRRRRRED